MWAIVQPSIAKQVGKLHKFISGMQPPLEAHTIPMEFHSYFFILKLVI